jgi:hypothetical protein
MRAHVADTSIDAYYGIVQDKKQRQYDLILSAMDLNRDYSYNELFDLTGILPSTLSARLNELREKLKVVERGPRRPCSKTGVAVLPHRIKVSAMVCDAPEQLELA